MRTGSMRTAEISMSAIRHNVQHFQTITNGAAVIAVMKANAYGHGIALAARAAIEGGATLLATADLEEALQLRELEPDAGVLCWLYGLHVDFDAAVEGAIEIGVSGIHQLDGFAAAAERAGATGTVHLKLDTGLSRNGASQAEWPEFFARAAELERAGRIRVRGLFSHLANAGLENDLAQGKCFDAAIELARESGLDPELLHLAATAAALRIPQLHYGAVRVGMGIYGLSPFPEQTSADLGLIPAMTLKAELIAMRDVAAGTGVSYGYNHICQRDTTLGLVPFGYADGMPRALNGAGATVAVAGVHCPIVGRIGMDQFIVDLGIVAKKVNIGDSVVLFGDPATGVPAVELWADLMRTINYEIVVGIGARVRRVAVA